MSKHTTSKLWDPVILFKSFYDKFLRQPWHRNWLKMVLVVRKIWSLLFLGVGSQCQEDWTNINRIMRNNRPCTELITTVLTWGAVNPYLCQSIRKVNYPISCKTWPYLADNPNKLRKLANYNNRDQWAVQTRPTKEKKTQLSTIKIGEHSKRKHE